MTSYMHHRKNVDQMRQGTARRCMSTGDRLHRRTGGRAGEEATSSPAPSSGSVTRCCLRPFAVHSDISVVWLWRSYGQCTERERTGFPTSRIGAFAGPNYGPVI